MQITMVGELMDVKDLGTQTDLVLDDGTGTVNVKLFRSGDEDAVRNQQLVVMSCIPVSFELVRLPYLSKTCGKLIAVAKP